ERSARLGVGSNRLAGKRSPFEPPRRPRAESLWRSSPEEDLTASLEDLGRSARNRRGSIGPKLGGLLDAQELVAEEDVIAVAELSLAADAHVRAVAGAEVDEREAAVGAELHLGVSTGHEDIVRKVHVAVFAPDLDAVLTRAVDHAVRAARDHLHQTERARALRRRVEVSLIR